jgi:hypothetical protein
MTSARNRNRSRSLNHNSLLPRVYQRKKGISTFKMSRDGTIAGMWPTVKAMEFIIHFTRSTLVSRSKKLTAISSSPTLRRLEINSLASLITGTKFDKIKEASTPFRE